MRGKVNPDLLDHVQKRLDARHKGRQIERARLLSLLQVYIDKPRPTVWDWLRNPAV
jgi:hypothetical protein